MKQIKTTVLLIVMLVTGLLILNNLFSIYTDIQKEYQKEIGKTIIISKDTLDVIDYSAFNDTYKLSDGSTISVLYYQKIRIKGTLLNK